MPTETPTLWNEPASAEDLRRLRRRYRDQEASLLVELERALQDLGRWQRVGRMLDAQNLSVPSVSRLRTTLEKTMALRERELAQVRSALHALEESLEEHKQQAMDAPLNVA